MATTKRKQKRASSKRSKSGVDAGIESMNKTMQATTSMVGNVAIAGMGIGLAGAVLGGLSK